MHYDMKSILFFKEHTCITLWQVATLENGDFYVTRFFDVANTQGELPILVFRGAHSLGLLLCKVCTAPEDKLPGGQAQQIQVIQKDLK